MTDTLTKPDYSARDKSIRINSYTTVLRRPHVPHEVFATYWRDVHGPLCARIPGLGWYVQHHFNREQDEHLWPIIDGIEPAPDYVLDGGVEIGFASVADQKRFKAASPILFADEQNIFKETIAYDLPQGSQTFVDRIVDPTPNESDTLDRLHVHFHAAHDDTSAFRRFMTDDVAGTMASDPALLKLRLHLPMPYDNSAPNPPAPDVEHTAPSDRINMAMIEMAFADPLARRRFFESKSFQSARPGQRPHIRYATPFAVSGVYTYVRDGQLTTAGLRGSRVSELIRRLGATNQTSSDVEHLIRTGLLSTP